MGDDDKTDLVSNEIPPAEKEDVHLDIDPNDDQEEYHKDGSNHIQCNSGSSQNPDSAQNGSSTNQVLHHSGSTNQMLIHSGSTNQELNQSGSTNQELNHSGSTDQGLNHSGSSPNPDYDMSNNNNSEKSVNDVEMIAGMHTGSFPVLYSIPGSTRMGQSSIQHTHDGSIRIQTPSQQDDPEHRPLRAKDLKTIKIVSVVALFFFFPTGIPALIFAFNCAKEFWKGVDTGQLDLAKKYYRTAERLSILSVVLGLISWVIVLAVIEKNVFMHDDNYYLHRHIGLLHT